MLGLIDSLICHSLKTTHLVVLPPQDIVVKPCLFFAPPVLWWLWLIFPICSCFHCMNIGRGRTCFVFFNWIISNISRKTHLQIYHLIWHVITIGCIASSRGCVKASTATFEWVIVCFESPRWRHWHWHWHWHTEMGGFLQKLHRWLHRLLVGCSWREDI